MHVSERPEEGPRVCVLCPQVRRLSVENAYTEETFSKRFSTTWRQDMKNT